MPSKSSTSKSDVIEKEKSQAKSSAVDENNAKSTSKKETNESKDVSQEKQNDEILKNQDVIAKVFEKAKDNPNDWVKCDTVRLENTDENEKNDNGSKGQAKSCGKDGDTVKKNTKSSSTSKSNDKKSTSKVTTNDSKVNDNKAKSKDTSSSANGQLKSKEQPKSSQKDKNKKSNK